jgi:ABC-2 type transport system permease protein
VSRQTDGDGRPARLLRFEWRLLSATPAPAIVASLFLLTAAIALANGYLVRQQHQFAAKRALDEGTEQYEAVRRDIARVEQQRAATAIPATRLQPGLPAAAVVHGRVNTFRAALPPLQTAVLSAGRTQMFPQRYELRGGGGARFWPFGRTVGTRIVSGLLPEQPMDNPSAIVLGALDLAFVVTYIYPILILALAYNVVSTDRETGTLALVAAQPIAFRRWLGTRVAVRGGVIAVFGLLLPVLGSALAMPEWPGDALMRLALWSVSVLAYASIWLAFAVAVSVLTSSPAFSAVVCVAGWLLFVVVIPAVLALGTPFLAPPSSRISYLTQERAASLDINPHVDAAIAALNQLVRTRFGGAVVAAADHPTFTEPIDPVVGGDLLSTLPQPPWSPPLPAAQLSRGFAEARRTLVEQRLAPILSELEANERREAAFFSIARFLSPALLLQVIGDEVAGTGRDRWTRFLGQLDDYVRQQDAFFTRKILDNENITSADAAGLIPFRYREEPTFAAVPRLVPPLIGLLFMAGALASLCTRVSRRWPS